MTSSPSITRDGARKSTRKKRPPVAPTTPPAPAAPSQAQSKAPTKGELLIVLLRRPDGVTAAQMSEATGWQLHSVRGFIAGTVKKKLGLVVATEKVDGQTVYRVVDEAAAA